MVDQALPSFDENTIAQAIEAAQRHSDKLRANVSTDGPLTFNDGALTVGAQCISVTVQNGQACLNLPVIGSKCFSVPSWVPNGTAVQACLDICTHWGIPCGVQVTLSAAGQKIISQNFGCAC